jgi:hypothetical protein
MNSPTAALAAAVVIAKNPPKGQSLEQGIPLGIILPAYPLNNYASFRQHGDLIFHAFAISYDGLTRDHTPHEREDDHDHIPTPYARRPAAAGPGSQDPVMIANPISSPTY